MKLLSYGSMNIDNVYGVAHIVTPGETEIAETRQVFCGGKGLNQSVAAARAGCTVFHAGAVGEDGEMLLRVLREENVDTHLVLNRPGMSAHTVIQVDANGQNSILVFSGEAMRPTEDEQDRMLEEFAEGDLLLLQNELFGSARMAEKAAAKGMRVVLNPSPMNKEIFEFPLERIAWFVMNEIEGGAITGETEPDAILAAMHSRYPNASVLLTLGEKGAICRCGETVLRQPAFPVRAVDTTAAGDTFTGYFLAGLMEGIPLEKILRRAAKAAAITVSRPGAAASIPRAGELAED